MKKILALILVLAMAMSFGLTAFADDDTPSPEKEVAPAAGVEFDDGVDPCYRVFNDKDELIELVPVAKAPRIGVGSASSLDEKDAEALRKAYEESKENKDENIRYLFWLSIPDEYMVDDFCYMEYPFTCSGENVKLSVNGNPMEVVHVLGYRYYAKLTEFGVIRISCD